LLLLDPFRCIGLSLYRGGPFGSSRVVRKAVCAETHEHRIGMTGRRGPAGTLLLRIQVLSVRRPAVLTDDFCASLQFLQTNTGIVL
jgi:hypothetical protein